MFTCLFSSLGIYNLLYSLLEEKAWSLKVFLLKGGKFDLRESLGGTFGGSLGGSLK